MPKEYVLWIAFHLFVITALAVDLGFFHRKAHQIRIREALLWSSVWLALALAFCIGILFFRGSKSALEFLTGYVVEWSLSVDNLFVFLTIFSGFAVPKEQQHRVLFWGILGALIMRATFIFAGVALLHYFHWMVYLFGAFLLFTGIKLALVKEKEKDHKNHLIIRIARKWLPITETFHQGKFFTRIHGRVWGTPLLLVLISIEFTDLIFATDSIPAILAITKDPFIVYTSNIFAILGLRSLYFALSGLMSMFHYLRYALAGILVFVGVKLCLTNIYQIPILISLCVIGVFLGGSIILSIIKARR